MGITHHLNGTKLTRTKDHFQKCEYSNVHRLYKSLAHEEQEPDEPLYKTREDDLKMIENLHRDADKSTKTIDELRSTNIELSTKNIELAKTLSPKEQTILNLEKDLYEQSETLNNETNDVREHLKLLFEEYKEALGQFGARPEPFSENDDVSSMMNWMLAEIKALPNVISGVSDFAAIFSFESLLKLLADFDCIDFTKLRVSLPRFPDAASTLAIRADEDVRALKVKFA
jgi:vacuolar-type H+-ATPase subunit I/STV1